MFFFYYILFSLCFVPVVSSLEISHSGADGKKYFLIIEHWSENKSKGPFEKKKSYQKLISFGLCSRFESEWSSSSSPIGWSSSKTTDLIKFSPLNASIQSGLIN